MTAAGRRPARDGERAAGVSGFSQVLASGEYRALWFGQAQSLAGDQVARVALTVLVYSQTRSPLLTAAAYTASVLPWLAGGLFLAGLADRWPRRRVMVSCDMARGGLAALMTVPGVPLPAMTALLFTVTLLDGPFNSARAGTLRDILPGDRYRAGVAVTMSTFMAAVVAGYTVGGILVAAIGARPSLLLDAATYLVSGALTRIAVAARPAARRPGGRSAQALTLVFASRRLRTCMLFGWLAGIYTVPAALAVPAAASLGGGPAAAGLVSAAGPLGTAAGAALFHCAGPGRQARSMGPLAVLCCASLALFAARPGLAGSLAIITGSGVLGCFQVAANAGFMTALRRDQQAQAFGVAQAGMAAVQSLSYLAAGAAAGAATPAVVIAAWGITGAAALALTACWRPYARPAVPGGDPSTPRDDPA